MKEAYAVRRTVPPSAEIEEQIDRLLAVGVGEHLTAACESSLRRGKMAVRLTLLAGISRCGGDAGGGTRTPDARIITSRRLPSHDQDAPR
jgi:hypothetical protein